jgi:hypothetical protein
LADAFVLRRLAALVRSPPDRRRSAALRVCAAAGNAGIKHSAISRSPAIGDLAMRAVEAVAPIDAGVRTARDLAWLRASVKGDVSVTYRDTVEDVSDWHDRPHDDAAPTGSDGGKPALLGFTPLEDRVIAMARGDSLGSIEQPGLIERLIGIVFGLRIGGRALADPRLEVLRQAVVIARHRHHLPDTHAARLQSHGFTLRQIRVIEERAVTA